MATFLDASLVGSFRGIFTFILVWIISFGLLEYAKPFGKGKKGLHSLIAAILSVFVFFSGPARAALEGIIPWITVLVIAFFFLIFSLMVFGQDVSQISEWLDQPARTTMLILVVLIVIFALSSAFDQDSIAEPEQQAPAPGANGTAPAQGYQGTYQTGPSGQQAPTRTQAAPQRNTPVEGDDFGDTLIMVFTHPTFLGLAFILLLGNFTIVFLAKD